MKAGWRPLGLWLDDEFERAPVRIDTWVVLLIVGLVIGFALFVLFWAPW